ncbi:hypothetical protein OEZ85_002158 [Tetradesmus obliquus]|uniref:Las1-like protein n=1 Tax=Tetradesmus obliquus TaxID=3088 RepID=A0ABY8U242_TETOB|nr:hypothetical protein OEZ85_002158 [Tetradesmus obliquus]
MAPGRTVPWCCWEEWQLVKSWLLSQSHSNIRRGIRRVEAWRARGRVPLGVDITASLLETALCDPAFWGQAAASAATAAAAAAAAGTGPAAASSVSQQQIRLQYSATIVRMVNGIADSQQKGRVALSVNSLAEAAGLSRLLVDVRHEATHNELPSLSTLQLAAKQALDWLVAQYWQRQADHLQACHSRILDILAAVYDSCQAAAAKGSAAAAAADEDEDDNVQEGPEDATEGQQGGSCGYKSSEGRKQRKQLLAELKGLLPPSHTPLLAALLLRGDALQLLQSTSSSSSSSAARKAQITALTSLSKQYPQLKQQLLEEAVSRLCRSPQEDQQQQQQQQPGVEQPMAMDIVEAPQQQQQQQQHEDQAFQGSWIQLWDGAALKAGITITATAVTFGWQGHKPDHLIERLAPYAFDLQHDTGRSLFVLLPCLDQMIEVNYKEGLCLLWVKKK